MTKSSGFAAEFAKQRAALGAGKTFTYNGKSYSTNRADDAKQPKVPKQPAATPIKPPAKISVKTLGPSGPQIAQDTMRALGVKSPSGPSPAQKNPSLATYQPSGGDFRKGGMVRKPTAKGKK